MEEHPQQHASSIWTRPYVWIAGGVAIVAMVSGFAYGAPSPPASQPVAVITEYRTAEPYVGGLEAAELASERHRLNRIKGHLNARMRKLNHLRERLAARKAALDGRATEQATDQAAAERATAEQAAAGG